MRAFKQNFPGSSALLQFAVEAVVRRPAARPAAAAGDPRRPRPPPGARDQPGVAHEPRGRRGRSVGRLQEAARAAHQLRVFVLRRQREAAGDQLFGGRRRDRVLDAGECFFPPKAAGAPVGYVAVRARGRVTPSLECRFTCDNYSSV